MLVFRTWRMIEKNILGEIIKAKTYRILWLFGIIPVFIWIDGK